MKPWRFVAAVVFLAAVCCSGADRALLLFSKSGEESAYRGQLEYEAELLRQLPQLGFAQEEIAVFSERAPAGTTPASVLRGLASRQRPGDRLWVFCFGHLRPGKRGFYFPVPGGVYRAEELRSALDAIPGEQMVFCFNSRGRELQELLRREGRVILSATAAPEVSNAPRYPRFFLSGLSGSGAGWLELMRGAAVAAAGSYRADGLLSPESPRLAVGLRVEEFPFSGFTDADLPPRCRGETAGPAPEASVAGRSEVESAEGEAVFLLREISVSFDPDGSAVVEENNVLQLNTEHSVEKFSRLTFSLPPGSTEFTLLSVGGEPPADGGGSGIRALREADSGVRFAGLSPGGRISWR